MTSIVKAACIQMHTEYQAKERNLQRARDRIREACANGAELLVLPEVFNVGTAGYTRAEAYENAEPIPSGETSQLLRALAKEHGVYICGSLIERDGVDLYNTAVLFGPEGMIGKYRKLQLCAGEALSYEPGNLGIPVFHTKLGRIAMLICLDAYYPETFRIAALQGADLVCVPFNAMDVQKSRGLPEGCHTMLSAICQVNALSNHIFVIGCNRFGECAGYHSAGQSVIANPWGAPVVPIAPFDREAILYAELDLSESRKKNINSINHRLKDRRTDVYSPMLGYDPERYRTN